LPSGTVAAGIVDEDQQRHPGAKLIVRGGGGRVAPREIGLIELDHRQVIELGVALVPARVRPHDGARIETGDVARFDEIQLGVDRTDAETEVQPDGDLVVRVGGRYVVGPRDTRGEATPEPGYE
jgi:hypothetical protein